MLDKSFDPAKAEPEISQKWQQLDLFAAHPESEKPPFSILIPPPNVTGELHLGHALNNAVQDVLCRYKRMKGFDVLWQPGTDHAGIATQMVVERELAKEGISRHDLGREKFIEKVWEWKEKSGGKIINQLHRLGSSADWARERFTMDEGLSRAVRKVFVHLYKEGLIYRDKRLVNWDPKLQTAISDLEVVQKETTGKMWYFNYPVENNPTEFITIATTRPETMFGDTAVAVNANDERYKHLIGQNVILPIANRPIPVVADEHADPEKGTGAVKITPGHDFNDFEVGKRHALPLINILDNQARLNENTPAEYHGMTCAEARPLVLNKIKDLGLYVKEEDNPMTIPYGDRSDVVIEPWLTDQWFVDTSILAKDAIKVVEDGQMRFVPKNWENTYFEWMRNIQPWCISRQLWWGHQVPVWYAEDGTQFCEETEAEAMAAAEKHFGASVQLTRDTDVLDTWFSSGLWAFSTLGWPDDTPHLKKYYPTSVLVTAFDIIFFWVARMVMMSMHFKHEIPFHDVYIHGLVRDEKGQKMSKSKNNGIDPLLLADKYGTDALRFSLLIQAGHGRDVLMSEGRVEGYRNFVTKIWNAVRFCEMNQADWTTPFNPRDTNLPINKWIITKLSDTANKIAESIDEYMFNDASNSLYHFVWGTFCDWYLEATKPIFYSTDEAAISETRKTAAFVVDGILKMAHPFMPFVTEELWDKTTSRNGMLMAQEWPELLDAEDHPTTKQIDWVFDFIGTIRSTRAEVNIPAGSKIDLKIKDAATDQRTIIQENEVIIKTLARLESMTFVETAEQGEVAQVFDGLTLLIPLAGLIDVAKETERLTKEIDNLTNFIERTTTQLNNQDFTAKAPEKVISEKRKSLEESQNALTKVREMLIRIGG